MDERIFLKGYIMIGAATLITAGMDVFLKKWWAYSLALLMECLVSGALQNFCAAYVQERWKATDPGAYAVHLRKRPPAMFRRGFRLGIDREYPYRDQKLVKDWRNFSRVANVAVIFIWLLGGACAILELDIW